MTKLNGIVRRSNQQLTNKTDQHILFIFALREKIKHFKEGGLMTNGSSCSKEIYRRVLKVNWR